MSTHRGFNIEKIAKAFGGYRVVGKRGSALGKLQRIDVKMNENAIRAFFPEGVDPTTVTSGTVSLHFHSIKVKGQKPQDDKKPA